MISFLSVTPRLFASFLAFALVPTVGLVAGPPQVTVVTADGNQLAGELLQIDEAGVHIVEGSATRVISGEDLSRIDFDAKQGQPLPTLVELVGGSRIRVSSLVWEDTMATLSPARQPVLKVPVSEIATIRFRKGNRDTDPVWLGWIQEQRRGDRLAVRRNEQALDSIDGTVVGMSRTAVEFDMGGNRIQAPLGKLEGVILLAAGKKSSDTAIRLTDIWGSSYALTSVALNNDRIEIILPGAITHRIPFDQVATIEYSGGVLLLHEAEIASAEFAAGSLNDPSRLALWRSWFAPTPESTINADNESIEPVIAMNTPGEITFRIPEGYQTLVAGVRRHNEVHQLLPVSVEVWVDGKQEWEAELNKRETLGLELPLDGARRLTLKATSNDLKTDRSKDPVVSSNNSLGGKLEWFGARILK